MTKEALKLALEALEPDVYRAEWAVEQDREKAITAIKAALAQPTSGDYALGYVEGFNDACKPKPAQEPVAWMLIQGRHEELSHWPLDDGEISRGWEQYPLYTTPPAQEQQSCDRRTWVGLTDEEIDAIYLQHHNQYDECESPNWGYERAIEVKLKEKNT